MSENVWRKNTQRGCEAVQATQITENPVPTSIAPPSPEPDIHSIHYISRLVYRSTMIADLVVINGCYGHATCPVGSKYASVSALVILLLISAVHTA